MISTYLRAGLRRPLLALESMKADISQYNLEVRDGTLNIMR